MSALINKLNLSFVIKFILCFFLIGTLIHLSLYLIEIGTIGTYLNNYKSDYMAQSLLTLPFLLPVINSFIFKKFSFLTKTNKSFITFSTTIIIGLVYCLIVYFIDYSIDPSYRDLREIIIFQTSLIVLIGFIVTRLRDLIMEIAIRT